MDSFRLWWGWENKTSSPRNKRWSHSNTSILTVEMGCVTFFWAHYGLQRVHKHHFCPFCFIGSLTVFIICWPGGGGGGWLNVRFEACVCELSFNLICCLPIWKLFVCFWQIFLSKATNRYSINPMTLALLAPCSSKWAVDILDFYLPDIFMYDWTIKVFFFFFRLNYLKLIYFSIHCTDLFFVIKCLQVSHFVTVICFWLSIMLALTLIYQLLLLLHS